LPKYTCDISSSSVVNSCFQINCFILWYSVDKAKTQNFNIKILWLGLNVTQIISKVILMMRVGTICHTHTVVEILDRVTSKA